MKEWIPFNRIGHHVAAEDGWLAAGLSNGQSLKDGISALKEGRDLVRNKNKTTDGKRAVLAHAIRRVREKTRLIEAGSPGWNCADCGKAKISLYESSCPNCGLPKPGIHIHRR